MKILSGTSNLKLSKNIAKNLKLKLINTNIRRFADGEIYIEINENIRGNSVFVIQSTSNPANDNLMELLLVIDALKRSSAKTITAVIPYFGYARQDRKVAIRSFWWTWGRRSPTCRPRSTSARCTRATYFAPWRRRSITTP